MRFSGIEGLVGSTPIQMAGQVDASARHQPGVIVAAVDNWWGGGEFIYGRANGSIRGFGLCVCTPTFDSTTQAFFFNFTEVPNTANLGRTLAVAMNAMTSGQFGWFQVSGITPVNCNASVAADTTFGIAAAGQGGANTAGKQVLNARIIAAGSTTVAKANCAGASGQKIIEVPNTEGWFVGLPVSGTGIAASTKIASINSDRQVTLDTNTTAAVAGTVTGTYNDATIFYNVAHLNRPFAQGAIT